MSHLSDCSTLWISHLTAAPHMVSGVSGCKSGDMIAYLSHQSNQWITRHIGRNSIAMQETPTLTRSDCAFNPSWIYDKNIFCQFNQEGGSHPEY